MIVVQVISVIAISALLIYMLFKGWNPIIAPLLAACLVMLFNGTNLMTGLTETYIPGFNQMITMFFLFFLGASILGALFKVSGAAETIADRFFHWFVEKREGRSRAIAGAIVCMLTCFVCSYGGLDAFCGIFMLMPIIMLLAKKSDLPRRFVPAVMFGGISSAQLGPGSPLTGNNFGSVFFETGATAAPVLGLIGMVIVMALIILYIIRSVGKAYDGGEHYEAGSYKAPVLREKEDRPPFLLAILPLIAVFICNTVLPLAAGISLDLYLCLAIGDAVAIVCFFPYMIKVAKKEVQDQSGLLPACRTLISTIGSGAQDGGFSILLIASGSAFAAVISASNGCATIMNWAVSLPLPTLVTFALAIIILTFLCGTPGCMIIAAPIFLPIAAQLGISNAVLMRIAVFGQCVLDTLPMNGAILLVTSQSGLSMKEAYPGVFKTTVLYMFIGTVVVTALAMIAPGIW
jgi:H+/gluconate symporter-like permease